MEILNPKKKILLATSTINLEGGGISSYAVDFCRLFKKKFSIYVVSSDIVNEELGPLMTRHYCLPSRDLSYNNAKLFLEIINKIEPDIIINSNSRILSLMIPFINYKTIKISISHFVDGQLGITAGYNWRHYNSIIALSEQGKIFLKKFYQINKSGLIEVIYNFYEDENIFSNLMLKNKEANKPLIITYPGGASLHKNPLLVFKLVRQLQKSLLSFEFYWLGNTQLPGGEIFGRKFIQDMIEPDDRIIFTKKIEREKAISIIKKSNIFLLPSLKEGCPISLMEAISGTVIPIVSDSKHASSELIDHGINGFILPENKEDYYFNLIEDIICNHEDYYDIYTNSKILYESKLSAKVWIEKMERVFSKPLIFENKSFRKFNLFFRWHRFIFKSLLFKERLKELYLSLKMFILFQLSK
ncbi:glycosyltransferase family 4 protein [Lutimonas vermicola]|uniref:Glycosyltransferase family 4 protein n=1 Tax=Lutimonas vermicola TaxID=414288 RepID=A0ABU9KY39_9FLAO